MADHKNGTREVPRREARRCPRYKLDARVRVSVLRTGQVVHARSTDLSEGGLALFIPLELQIGEVLDLEFTLPYTRDAQHCGAVVRNRGGYRYGVELRNLTAGTRQAIARVCKALALLA